MQINEILSFIGNQLAVATTWLIKQLANLGLNISSVQAKIINIILLLLLIWLASAVISESRKLIKWVIILLFIVLIVSTGFSFLA